MVQLFNVSTNQLVTLYDCFVNKANGRIYYDFRHQGTPPTAHRLAKYGLTLQETAEIDGHKCYYVSGPYRVPDAEKATKVGTKAAKDNAKAVNFNPLAVALLAEIKPDNADKVLTIVLGDAAKADADKAKADADKAATDADKAKAKADADKATKADKAKAAKAATDADKAKAKADAAKAKADAAKADAAKAAKAKAATDAAKALADADKAKADADKALADATKAATDAAKALADADKALYKALADALADADKATIKKALAVTD